MQIHVGSGIGTGPTKMAAFDSALNEVGIANYNMLSLSSIVPPDAEVVVHDGKIQAQIPGNWGDRMYIVMAELRVDRHNVDAWACIAWVQDKKTGRGLFTEHSGNSEAYVRREASQTLEALMSQRSAQEEFEWGDIQMKTVGRTCTDKPVCALVAAVFQVTNWDNQVQKVAPEEKKRFWERKA